MTAHSKLSIAARVKVIITEHLGVEPERVTDDASLIDDLNADSLDSVELSVAFEEEFAIELTDDDLEAIRTVGDAVKTVERAIGGRAHG